VKLEEGKGNLVGSEIFQFEKFTFNLNNKTLYDEKGDYLPLRKQSSEVLTHLIRNADQIVSKGSLLEKVWNQTVVTEDSLTQCISEIRKALKDTEHKLLRTFPKKGYLIESGSNFDSGVSTFKPNKFQPTLAIIPPLYTGDKNNLNAILGEIVAYNLIESISLSPLISVISRLTTRQFVEPDIDLKTINRVCSADYILTGLIYTEKKKIYIGFELSHGIDSKVVYAEKFSSSKENWLRGNKDSLCQIAHSIVDTIIHHQSDLTTSEPIESLPLHTLLINAVTSMHNSSQLAFDRSELILKRIQKNLPQNATVLSLLAQWHLMSMNRVHGWNLNSDSVFQGKAFDYAEQALAINPLHSHANTIMGSLESRVRNNSEMALEHHNTAMISNPNNALNHCFKASAYTYHDNTDNAKFAVSHAKRAIELSPLDPQLYLFLTVAATTNHYAEKLDAARRFASEAYKMNPSHTSNLRTLVSVLIDSNRINEARQMGKTLMRLDPALTITNYRAYGPGSTSRFADHIAYNLEKAGVPVH